MASSHRRRPLRPSPLCRGKRSTSDIFSHATCAFHGGRPSALAASFTPHIGGNDRYSTFFLLPHALSIAADRLRSSPSLLSFDGADHPQRPEGGGSHCSESPSTCLFGWAGSRAIGGMRVYHPAVHGQPRRRCRAGGLEDQLDPRGRTLWTTGFLNRVTARGEVGRAVGRSAPTRGMKCLEARDQVCRRTG